jgi:AhpD family alkylhydroperoxidase
MQTIPPIQIEHLSVATQRLLQATNGEVSNMLRTMAHSPCALQGFVEFKRALNVGRLSAKIREQIALAVAQTNLCEYSLTEHAHRAALLGLTPEEIRESRAARARDWGTDVVLRFARDLAARRGEFSVVELRESGCNNEDIIELMALVALNVFENYINDVALTEVDFPKLERTVRAA